MPRYVFIIALIALGLGCANPPCPAGTERASMGRCVTADGGPLDDAAVDGGLFEDPDAQPGFVTVEVPEDTQRIVRGERLSVEFAVAQGPSYYGAVEVAVAEGLPEGINAVVTSLPGGPALELDASAGAAVGLYEITLRAHIADYPELVGRGSFWLRVAGSPGSFDEGFDDDGIRTDVPFDGTEDTVVAVAVDDLGGVTVAGNGQTGTGSPRGFVSWYAEDGRPAHAIAEGGTRQIYVAGERSTRIRGFLPTSEGTLLTLEVDGEERVIRMTSEGDGDASFEMDPTVSRPDVLWGGELFAHQGGFLVHFSQQVERYQFDGTLDRAFGTRGALPVPHAMFHQAAISAEGGILIGSTTTTGFRFLRYDASGEPHLGFGERGTVEMVAPYGVISAIVPLEGGGFAVVVRRADFTTGRWASSLVWLTSTGVLDTSIGEGGVLVYDDGSGDDFELTGALREGATLYVHGVRTPDIGPPRGFVAALTPEGAHDGSFGEGGIADLGALVFPKAAAVDRQAGRLVIGCDHPLSTASDALQMIAVARLWL